MFCSRYSNTKACSAGISSTQIVPVRNYFMCSLNLMQQGNKAFSLALFYANCLIILLLPNEVATSSNYRFLVATIKIWYVLPVFQHNETHVVFMVIVQGQKYAEKKTSSLVPKAEVSRIISANSYINIF